MSEPENVFQIICDGCEAVLKERRWSWENYPDHMPEIERKPIKETIRMSAVFCLSCNPEEMHS